MARIIHCICTAYDFFVQLDYFTNCGDYSYVIGYRRIEFGFPAETMNFLAIIIPTNVTTKSVMRVKKPKRVTVPPRFHSVALINSA
jgi:hypothetical protein